MPAVNPPKLDGLNSITAANDGCTVNVAGGGAVAPTPIVNGDYFIHRHTGVPAEPNQLIERFETSLETVVGVSVTITVSDTTGRVTIRNDHAVNSLNINWTEVGLRDLLGFGLTGVVAPTSTGVIAANGGTVTGANGHLNGWYPNRPPAELLGDPSLAGVLLSDAQTHTSPSGRTVTTKYFEHRVQSFRFEEIDRNHALPLDGTIVSFEQFWQRILSLGIRWRYYPDRADRDGPAGAGPFTYVADTRTTKAGTKDLARTLDRWTEYYNIEIDARAYVA